MKMIVVNNLIKYLNLLFIIQRYYMFFLIFNLKVLVICIQVGVIVFMNLSVRLKKGYYVKCKVCFS